MNSFQNFDVYDILMISYNNTPEQSMFNTRLSLVFLYLAAAPCLKTIFSVFMIKKIAKMTNLMKMTLLAIIKHDKFKTNCIL